jgi:hypothetical protein
MRQPTGPCANIEDQSVGKGSEDSGYRFGQELSLPLRIKLLDSLVSKGGDVVQPDDEALTEVGALTDPYLPIGDSGDEK